MKMRYLFIFGLITSGSVAFAQYTPSYAPPPDQQQPQTQPPYAQPPSQYAQPQSQYSQSPSQYSQPQYSQQPQYPQPQYSQPSPYAQQYPTNQYSQGSAYASAGFSPAQLDQLVSPVALYPDPLLGAILPASAYPDQVAAAANFDANNSDPSQIDQQPWDDSVKTLAHYPAVAEWMAQNAQWTQQLGAAVAGDEQSVLNAIQQLRVNARAAGMLVDTPQQRVVDENNQIAILPAQPNVVYVPTYNPQWIENSPPPGARFSLSFGPAFRIGAWDHFDLDWNRHAVWINRSQADGEHEDDRRFATREQWQPPREMHDRDEFARRQGRVFQPRPFGERGNERRDLTPTGRFGSPAMEYNQPGREQQPRVEYNHNTTPDAHAEHGQERDVQPQNNGRKEDRKQRHHWWNFGDHDDD